MRFVELAIFFDEVEKTRSRNAMTEMLADVLKRANQSEVRHLCYMLLGKLGPLYQQVDLGLADKMVIRSLSNAFIVDAPSVILLFKNCGDLGETARELSVRYNQTDTPLVTVQEVFDLLSNIALESGEGSQERKVHGLMMLLSQVTPIEAKYVIRLALGKMRLGYSDKTILDALSVMERGNKQGRVQLDWAYQVMPDIGYLAELVKLYGIADIHQRVDVTLGVPVMPALAQRLRTAQEMINKMGEVFVEPKYDGTRVQIHIRKLHATRSALQKRWKIKTFTRNLEETTWMFPELATALDQVNADEVILDSEAVGIHPKTGKMLPFQMTITRKRKHGVREAAIDVPLRFFIFDILYKDGVSLLQVPLQQRRELLSKVVGTGKTMVVDEFIRTQSADELRDYHKQQLQLGLEGVVVKQVHSAYEPGRRGWSWVKFKEVEESSGKLSDTIDCVVMGFYRGQGKRSSFGIGAFLVGIEHTSEIRNPKSEINSKIVTVAKIGTGLSDVQWKELRMRLEQSISVDKPKEYEVHNGLIPDVWVDPVVIVEIAADEVTTSPIHSAGFALRFPRLVSFRDDKSINSITTMAELKQLKQMTDSFT